MTQSIAPTPALPNPPRSVGEAMKRGALGRCPACGEARMMQGYLTVRATCPNCGEVLHHHRADDGPAYFTILVVSHLAAPLLLLIYTLYRPSTEVLIAAFLGGAALLSLLLLPVFKGAFVGLQWAKRMHGFGGDDPHLAPDPHHLPAADEAAR